MLATGLFHPGRQHSWHTAAALAEARDLAWYATAIFYDPQRFPYSLAAHAPGPIGRRMRSFLERRATDRIDPAAVRHLPAAEWLELAFARLSLKMPARWANDLGNDAFQRAVIRLAEKEPVARLWGYDTSALHAFRAARASGTICVLDQSIAHMGGLRTQLLEQRERFGDLIRASEIPGEREVARGNAEIAAADHVVVGSRYAADLAVRHGARPEVVHICPYGYSEANFSDVYSEAPGLGKLPVRFVFVGSVSARKGFHLLADVFSRMPPERASLTVIGPSTLPESLLRRHLGNIVYHPAVPNERLRAHLSSAHCFVFPSLHEGGGIVLYEAAASGLGIIQTANCGDGVRTGPLGANGVVLREATADSLRAEVEEVIARPAVLRDWSAASWAMRRERSWSEYRRRIVELLPKLT